MSAVIRKIKFQNYKKFSKYTIEPNNGINVIVGDNEAGKSTILQAIDLVISGSVHRVESEGIDKLLNIDSVREFLAGNKTFENLPVLFIELYLQGSFDFTMNGKNNSDQKVCDGIRLICEPNEDFRSEIKASLSNTDDYFPYDYYRIRFSTFADEGYSGYKKRIHSVFIDSSTMNSEYATSDFVQRMFFHYTEQDEKERTIQKNNYRLMRNRFNSESLFSINSQILDKHYCFGLKNGSAVELESDLMIYEDDIGLDSKGTGKQVFIKTDFALEKSGKSVDVILIEEPENHLSDVNLRKLIQRISETHSGQLFVATHNSLICTRLELNNLLILSETTSETPITLKELQDDTAAYFMKAPPASIVEFAVSRKTILVEGPSEYMLMEKFYESCTGNKPEQDNVHIIDVRGLSFKRYLEVASLTGCKVAVITDNDGNFDLHCVHKYDAFDNCKNIGIFFDKDNSKPTFEVVLHASNEKLCQKLFPTYALDYMLSNKTEVAYKLLEQSENITVPDYIRRAILWIKN